MSLLKCIPDKGTSKEAQLPFWPMLIFLKTQGCPLVLTYGIV